MQIQVDEWRAPFYQESLFPSVFSLWEESVLLDHKHLQNVIYIWIGPRAVTKTYVKIDMSMAFKTILLLFCSLSTWVLQSLCWQREVCQMPTSQLYLWGCVSELQVWKELLSLWERPSIHGLHQWVAIIMLGAVILAPSSVSQQLASFLSHPIALSHLLPPMSSYMLFRLPKIGGLGLCLSIFIFFFLFSVRLEEES